VVNSSGDSALHFASRSGSVECARELLKAGASNGIENAAGARPLDLVRYGGRGPRGARAGGGGGRWEEDKAAPPRTNRASSGVMVANRNATRPRPLPRPRAQACKYRNKWHREAMREVLSDWARWHRRRCVAIACYGDVWEEW
jgi:hypothetical protein